MSHLPSVKVIATGLVLAAAFMYIYNKSPKVRMALGAAA